ncbi:MAG: InlB B-repeat-containing protein, partial [Anaeroplasmataceae bacterium]|nr:InlB B-repeat-containing protein [Anaeroplasmataceae bacterium]
MKLAKKIFSLFILLISLLFCVSINAAEKKRLDAKDFISNTSEDQTSEINTFLTTCKTRKMDAFFSKGVYKFNGTIVLADGVSLFGEEGTIFRGTGTTYQSYIRDTKEKVTNITIDHIIFDNVTMYFQNSNSTNITIEHSIFANAKRVDLSISTGLQPVNNQNGGEWTGYYIAKNHKTIAIRSNLFFRDENSLGRCISIYYTENALIQDNYFGIVEDIDKSIVSPETKALKEEAMASGILSETSNQGYFMSAINVINSDKNAKIIGNHFSINTDISEERYEDRSQSTDGYNRDHIIYAKMFNGLEVVGNYFKGMNKNQDGGIKFRNGENLLIHKNVLEDTMILLYVQNANTNLWFRNVHIKENIFINRFYTTDSYTSSITNIKKNFSAEFLFLLMNYEQTADVRDITIESNKMISPKFANEEVRIDNLNYAMPTNVTVRNNINSIVNQSIRTQIVRTNGKTTWYDSNTSGPNFTNVAEDSTVFTMDTSAYEDISVDALVNLNEVAFELQERKLVTNAKQIYVDGTLYDDKDLAYGEHYIFLTDPTTVPLVVEGTTRTLQTNLFTAQKILVERSYKIAFETNQHGATVEEEYSPKIPTELPTLSEDGYIFGGWYIDESLTQKANPGEKIEQDVVLYAKWTKLHNVTYNTLGHGAALEGLSNVLALPEILPVLNEEGYIFDGWYLDTEFTVKAIENTSITEDIILYAKWIKLYTVTYNTLGHGAALEALSNVLALPERLPMLNEVGYIFNGWYLDTEFTVKAIENTSISEDITLYAKWTKIPVYTVTFDSQGGTMVEALVLIEGSKLTELTVPLRTGYIFRGWYIDLEYSALWNIDDVINKDVTLYAKWDTQTQYTVTFQYVGGGVFTTLTVVENGFLSRPEDQVISGHRLDAWYKDEACTVAFDFEKDPIIEDTILYGKWVSIEVGYTITYQTNGHGIAQAEANGAMKLPNPLPVLTEAGYVFGGWYTDKDFKTPAVAGTSIQANTTLYAKWTKQAIYYTVTFMVEDTVIDAVSVLESGKLTRPEDPYKEGFTFYGWYEDETYTTQWNFEKDAVLGPVTLYGIFVGSKPASSNNGSSILLYILIPSVCVLACGGFGGVGIF